MAKLYTHTDLPLGNVIGLSRNLTVTGITITSSLPIYYNTTTGIDETYNGKYEIIYGINENDKILKETKLDKIITENKKKEKTPDIKLISL